MNTSYNEKYFGRKLYRKSKHTFYGQHFLLIKIVPFMRLIGKTAFSQTATHDNRNENVSFAAG